MPQRLSHVESSAFRPSAFSSGFTTKQRREKLSTEQTHARYYKLPLKWRCQSCASRCAFMAAAARHPFNLCVKKTKKEKKITFSPKVRTLSRCLMDKSDIIIKVGRRFVCSTLFHSAASSRSRYLSCAPRTVECAPHVKGRILSICGEADV